MEFLLYQICQIGNIKYAFIATKILPLISTISNISNWQHQIYQFCIRTSVRELSPVNPWSQPCFLYLSFPASSQSSENLIYNIWKFLQQEKIGMSIHFLFVRKYLNEIWPRYDLWRVSGETIFMKFEHKVWRLIKCSPYISQNNKLLRALPWLEKSLDNFVIFTASWFISCGAWVEILKLQGPRVVNVKVWLHYQSWRQSFIVKVGENLGDQRNIVVYLGKLSTFLPSDIYICPRQR